MAATQAGLESSPNISQAIRDVRKEGGIVNDGAVDGDALNSYTANNHGGNSATRVYALRSFERPTENFTRKTGMRDRGPPGFEYNDTQHLSIAANATLRTG